MMKEEEVARVPYYVDLPTSQYNALPHLRDESWVFSYRKWTKGTKLWRNTDDGDGMIVKRKVLKRNSDSISKSKKIIVNWNIIVQYSKKEKVVER